LLEKKSSVPIKYIDDAIHKLEVELKNLKRGLSYYTNKNKREIQVKKEIKFLKNEKTKRSDIYK
jgi:hypothetical protein